MDSENASAYRHACESEKLGTKWGCLRCQYFVETLNNEENARKEREPVDCKFRKVGIKKLANRHKTGEANCCQEDYPVDLFHNA